MFRFEKSLLGNVPKVEYIKGSLGEVFLYGEALIILNGSLTRCPQDRRPEFISLSDTSCKRKVRFVPVMRTFGFYLFKCPVECEPQTSQIDGGWCLDKEALGIVPQKNKRTVKVININSNTALVRI